MRAFVAIELDELIRRALGRVQTDLRSVAGDFRFVAAESIHLTLSFLGEIDARRVPHISAALDRAIATSASVAFAVRGLGVFADRNDRIRVVWAGIDDSRNGLALLQAAVAAALDEIGFPPERRPFTPHLTLARSKIPKRNPALLHYVESAETREFGSQTVAAITLYESTLTPRGPIYVALSKHALRRA